MSGLGSGFRQGFKLGQQSVMGRRGGAGAGIPGMRRTAAPNGMGRNAGMGQNAGMGRTLGGNSGRASGGGYGGLGRLKLSRRLRRSLDPTSRIPAPPRIQLIDLPSNRRGGVRRLSTGRNYHGRLKPGQLGTGMGLGMTGRRNKQHRFHYPTHMIQAALAQGASMKDLAKAAYLTDLGFTQAKEDARKKRQKRRGEQEQEEEEEEEEPKSKGKGKGFGGFKGFDGFGSGYYHTDKEKKARRRGGRGSRGSKKRFDPAAVTFGLEKQRRRLVFDDEEDVDVYDYDAMENERKCVLYAAEHVYEICVGYDFVEIKKFLQRQEYAKRDAVVSFDFTSMDEQFVQYVTYEHNKYRSMMQSSNANQKQMDLLQAEQNADGSHYVNVYEFVYDEETRREGGEEQCFTFLQPFEICLDLNAQHNMIVNIKNEEFVESVFSVDFSNDADWNEVNEIVKDRQRNVIEKCVRLFEAKMCVHCENDTQYKMLLYRTE